MTFTRLIVTQTLALATLLILSGCFEGSAATTGATTDKGGTSEGQQAAQAPAFDLNSTTWSGTDSLGTITVFEFQPDGTVGVTSGTDVFDEVSDTWVLSGTALTVTVYIDAALGNAVYTGTVSGVEPIDLVAIAEGDNSSWIVTVTKL